MKRVILLASCVMVLLARENPFVPDDWYVLENAGIDGIIIWQDKTGRIYQTMPNGQKEYIADSLAEYLDKQ